MRTRRGQALIELTLGLFALALLVSAFAYVVQYMVRSLRVQNQLRTPSPIYSDRVKLDDFAAAEVFGQKTLHVNEPHGQTDRSIR